MTTPRIAIPQPTSHDLPYNQKALPLYLTAISRSGGEPVVLDLGSSASVIAEVLATCHGVVLPGSPADVDPQLYGEARHPATAAADPAREAADFQILELAEKAGKPVLGICFGVQALNTWRGGSLVQDLTPLPVNHEAGSKVAIAHTALVPESSLLAEMVDRVEAPLVDGYLRLPVNTSHHQAVAVPGEGLKIAARCPDDGVIEAVELFHVEQLGGAKEQFVLGVQWHPERSYEISPTSRAIFDRLISEANLYADAHR
jgi:putative glutamine amidotransferase